MLLPGRATLGPMVSRGMPPPVHTLVIAEDDRAVRESLVRALELEGYHVTAVGNGAEALDVAARSPPTSSCSTCRCRSSTASRCARCCGPTATACRS